MPLTTLKQDKQTTVPRPVPADVVGVSIIVPCLNEEEGFGELVERLDGLLLQLRPRFAPEVIFVDDGSSDRTFALMEQTVREKSSFRSVRHPQNRGLMAAILSGVQASRQEIVCSIDADCTYDPALLCEMLPLLTDDVTAVVASPYHPQGTVENVPAWRLFLSKSASRFYRLIFRQKLHTYTSCFRVMRREAICDMPVRNLGFLGITEMLWQMDRSGARLIEYPAKLSVRRYGQSKIRVFRVAMDHARFFLRATWERLRGVSSSGKQD